ncbi:unnamed protein product [Rangifer tarandus platyrhynchus]|uniref:Uncharacterized protein n=1 Tax=Rangifer tarandus platyrhynchus TaxID=3082113 RepID=A0AC59Y4B3_RANTA
MRSPGLLLLPRLKLSSQCGPPCLVYLPLPGQTVLGPPELPCPESREPTALRVGRFPDSPPQQLPEQSVQLPQAGVLSRAFLL